MLQLVLATVELVSETVAATVAEPAQHAAEAKMPQLVVESFPQQLFWLAVVFVVFYLILSRYALPRLGVVLGLRSQQIDKDLAAAKELHEQSEKIIFELDGRIAVTQTAINEQLAKRHNELRDKTAAREAIVMAELAEKAHELDKFILHGKEQAIEELRRQTPELVATAVERLMGEKPKLAEIDQQIELAMQRHKLNRQGVAN